MSNENVVNQQEQEPSASIPNEEEDGTEVVAKAELKELRGCKRKLVEENEPELQHCKRKLEENESELQRYKHVVDLAEVRIQKDGEKLRQLKTLVATGVKFRPKRARISMELPNFAALTQDQENFPIFSNAVDVAGFKWDVYAQRGKKPANVNFLALGLRARPPKHYKGPFQFEIDLTLRLLNTYSSQDICKEWKDRKIVPWPNHNIGAATAPQFAAIESLVDKDNDFLQDDGSIRVEADFLVKTATLDHFLVDDDGDGGDGDDDQDNKGDDSKENEESVNEEKEVPMPAN